MAIDWKTIISEFDGKPTLLQAIGKLRKAVEDETITIQQAQAEIAKLESQQKVDETLINTAQTTANNALDLAKTNEKDIGTLDGQVAEIENNKVDKIKSQSEYVQLYGVSKQGQQTTYEGTELNVPWKFVRRDANGNIQISSSKKSSDAVTRGELDVDLAGKQKILSAEKSFVFNGKQVNAPAFYDGEMLVSNGIKTLFGNQSLYGQGNIDLYRHIIQIQKGSGGSPSTLVFLSIVSSSNLKVDSLTDLKQLLSLPDYGFYPVSGICETTGIAVSINKSLQDVLKITSVKGGNLSEYTIVDETITDTVTTI